MLDVVVKFLTVNTTFDELNGKFNRKFNSTETKGLILNIKHCFLYKLNSPSKLTKRSAKTRPATQLSTSKVCVKGGAKSRESKRERPSSYSGRVSRLSRYCIWPAHYFIRLPCHISNLSNRFVHKSGLVSVSSN